MKKVVLVDDLDGRSDADGTHKLSLNGQRIELDLTDEHAKELQELLAPYFDAGRNAGGTPAKKAASSGSKKSSNSSDRAAKIRAWAARNGVEVGIRGAIPKDVQDQYDAAMAES